MFFAGDDYAPHLLDVLHFTGPAFRAANTLHRHAALSVRFESDTTITMDEKKHHLFGENVSYFPPDTPYLRESRIDRMIVFHFTLENAPPAFETFVPSDFARVGELSQQAYDAFCARRPGYRYAAASCFFDLLACLRRERDAVSPPSAADAGARYIAAHLGDSTLTVAEIARAVFVSEVHLRTLFHRRFGLSPKAYLTRERIAYARTLLESGFYTVEECGRRAGFPDPKNFATAMREKTGKTPSAYRRR